MRRFLYILIILFLWPSLAIAEFDVHLMQLASIDKEVVAQAEELRFAQGGGAASLLWSGGEEAAYDCSDDVCSGCIQQERSECSNLDACSSDNDNNETTPQDCSGTIEFDETTDVLQGTESISVGAASSSAVRLGNLTGYPHDSGYAAFIFKNVGGAGATGGTIFQVYATDFLYPFTVAHQSDETFSLRECTGGTRDTDDADVLGAITTETVYIKVQWNDSTDVVNWWTSLTGKSGEWNAEGSITVDDCDMSIRNVRVGNIGGNISGKTVWDDIRTDDADINYP